MEKSQLALLKQKYQKEQIDIYTYLLVLHLELINTNENEKSVESINKNIPNLKNHVTAYEIYELLTSECRKNYYKLDSNNTLTKIFYRYAC